GALAAVIGLVPFGAHAETLRQALASAYENNPSLASSLVALRISGERITQAEAGYLPSVNGNAGITHRLGFQNSPASTSTSLGLQLSHNLWNGGATDAGVSAAISGYEASQQTVRSAEQDVLLAAANAYMNV